MCFESCALLKNAIKTFSAKARGALNSIWRPLTALKIEKMSLRKNLFNALVRSVLFYAIPAWLNIDRDNLETIQNAFFKKLLSLRRETPSCIIHKETESEPLKIKAFEYLLNYWHRILSAENSTLLKQAYLMQLKDIDRIPLNCAAHLKNTLNKLGFSFIWLEQSTFLLSQYKTEIIKRLLDHELNIDKTKLDNLLNFDHYKYFQTRDIQPTLLDKKVPFHI